MEINQITDNLLNLQSRVSDKKAAIGFNYDEEGDGATNEEKEEEEEEKEEEEEEDDDDILSDDEIDLGNSFVMLTVHVPSSHKLN